MRIIYAECIGNVYNDLTVLALAKRHPISNVVMFHCKCICGNIIDSVAYEIVKGRTKSCGCLGKRLRAVFSPSKNDPKITSAKKLYRERYKDGNLTFDDFYQLSQMSCHYCGVEPSQKFNWFNVGRNKTKASKFTRDNGEFIYNGIDRIDSSLGHIIGNVVPCCKTCNFAKRNMSVEEFKSWVSRVFRHCISD